MRTTAICTVLAAAIALGPCASHAQTTEPIRIGAVMPLTSVFATYGHPEVEAIKMVTEEVNKNGGINGRPIELVVEDSSNSNTMAINALNKVLEAKPVALVVSSLAPQVLAELPTVDRERIPTIAAPSAHKVTQMGSHYFFRIISDDAVDKALVTRFLVDDLKKRQIGLLYVADEWGYSGRDNVTADLKQFYDLAPVSMATYQPTDKDMTAQILQLQKAGTDAIFSQGHPVDEALLSKQVRELDLGVPHVGSPGLCYAFQRGLIDVQLAAGMYCEALSAIPQFSDNPPARELPRPTSSVRAPIPTSIRPTTMTAWDCSWPSSRRTAPIARRFAKASAKSPMTACWALIKSDAIGNMWHRAVIMELENDGSIKVVKRSTAG